MVLKALDPLIHPLADDTLYTNPTFIENFFHLIDSSVIPPYAISVDGLWGTGKTTTMKMLQKKFENEGYPVFWFNPWEYRQTQNVVLAFLQCLADEYKDVWSNESVASSWKMLRVLLEVGLEAGLKAITQGTISLDLVKKLFSEYENKEQKKSFQVYQNTIQTIKKEFTELIKIISQSKGNKPMIIFFDDLDRCLPDDTIELLEALKNLFVTPGSKSIFICGIDTHIAKRFIDEHYKNIGENFAINYFRKIFNLTVSMPYISGMSNLLTNYIKELFQWTIASDLEKATRIANHISSLCRQAHISSIRKHLNIITNIFARQKLNSSYDPENPFIHHLLVLKEAWEPLYEELKHESLRRREPLGTLVPKIIQRRNNYKILLPEQEEFLNRIGDKRDYGKEYLEKWLVENPMLS